MKNSKISESELVVMQILWNNKNLTLKEINALLANNGWSYSTIKTMLNRLVKKGYINVDDTNSKCFIYSPVYTQESYRKKEFKSFLDKLYNGSKALLINELISDSDLSENDINKLKKIVDKMRN